MKIFYLLFGFLFIALGVIGVVVPGLPTTPFLLLALYCFGKGSERMKRWFMQTRLYKRYLQEYDRHRAMTLKQKISILAFSAPFCLFALFTLPNIWGKVCLILVIVFQYYYFLVKIKTLEKESATLK